jgi:beta-xylosidase
MICGGSPDLNDQPDYFGIAKSKDLITWEKHPGNPIFGIGAKGEEDGGAIWFPALIEIKTHYVMLYEGSRGRYAWDLSSQICMSSIKKS